MGRGAGTFQCTKAGRVCELCRGGSWAHKACPTSLAVAGNNTDLAIKAIPNLLVINHRLTVANGSGKTSSPFPLPLLHGPSSGFELPLCIYGVLCWVGRGMISPHKLDCAETGWFELGAWDTLPQPWSQLVGERRRPQSLAPELCRLFLRSGRWPGVGKPKSGGACHQLSSLSFPHLTLIPRHSCFPSFTR